MKAGRWALLGLSALSLVQGCGDSERSAGPESVDADRSGAAGGAPASGGTANGGTANGGTANGGTANGGTANGGTANGGGSGGKGSGGTSASGTGGAIAGAASGGTSAEAGESGSGAPGVGGADDDGGAGGSSGMAGGGTGGAAPSNVHCAPAAANWTPLDQDISTPCYGDDFVHGLPNALNVSIRDLVLPTPTVPGEKYAVSVRHDGGGPIDLELWGADSECGVVGELLWWSPFASGTLCAEFTPNAAYSHLFYVYRQNRDTNYLFTTEEILVCPSGTCAGGVDGQGLEPGAPPLAGPTLVYERTDGSSASYGYEIEVGRYGHLNLIREGSAQPDGTPNPIASGVFRMPKDDPFGDAWYCVGQGSTITMDSEDASRFSVSLKNLTRLPACQAGSGTISISSVDARSDITSSFGQLSGSDLSSDLDCFDKDCTLRFFSPNNYRWLYLKAAESVGNYFEPTLTPTAVSDVFVFGVSSTSLPLITCSSSGVITYDPDGTTSVELDSLAESFTCPGEPAVPGELEFTTL
jgi:hypothetical protein